MSEPLPYADTKRERCDEDETFSSLSLAMNHDVDYVNYPNYLKCIPDAEFKADLANLFIAFNPLRNELCIERRAFPLLRPPLPPANINPKPGFVSFIGETGAGKSWVLRSLKRNEDHSKYPSPLVRPARKPHNFSSTSSDVHLYADSATSESPNPILFLDFEGLAGSRIPASLKASSDVTNINRVRREFIRDAYPRIAYAFSNCIILVAHHQMSKAYHFSQLLSSYSNCGFGGSRDLGFKPALIIVFNQIPFLNFSPSAWSIEKVTAAFLANRELKDVQEHYHEIFVIKIPELQSESSKLVIDQLQNLDRLLRKQHAEACKRRIAFGLDFTPDEVTAYLMQALRVFTDRKDAVFDWLEQSYNQHEMPVSMKTAQDKWVHFFRYFRDSCNLSSVKAFEAALEAFYSHFIFCVHLHLSRHPLIGRTVESIPPVLEDAIRDIDVVIFHHVPCGGAKDGLECDRINATHDIEFHSCGTMLWRGRFVHAVEHKHSLRAKVVDSLATTGPPKRRKLSIKDSKNITVLSKIRPVHSCVGCFSSSSTILSCEHAFCEECVQDITLGKDLHRIDTIKCPFCQDTSREQHFSPRFLPHAAGYRILSLDGGGVHGIAQIKILQAIEMRCFNIPIVHLFDFFVGTSIGGQVILALASRESPITLSDAETAFSDLICKGIKPKKSSDSSIWQLLTGFVKGSPKSKARTLDADPKYSSQGSSRFLSDSSPPFSHVAVTASSRASFQKRVIPKGPNHMRRLSGDSNGDTGRSVLSLEPKSTPAWVVAGPGIKFHGEYRVDGGLVASCPAKLAVDEARCIWPNRRMDTLVSIGTGVSIAPHASKREEEGYLKITKTSVHMVANSEKLWAEFQMHYKSEIERVVRLQPTYGEVFPFDAVNKLDSISREVQAWLTTQTDQIDRTSNQLIASLFFFKPSILHNQSDTLSGNIECRLPPGLHVRSVMVKAFIKVAQAHELFTFDIPDRGRSGQLISGTLRFLEDLLPDEELSIPVTIDNLPLIGQSTIDIKLCDIFGNGTSRYSISGCPFTIRE